MFDLIISGYSSFDHMLKLRSDAEVGRTALIANATCTKIYWGGCSVNVAVALQRLGASALPILRVGSDYESSGFAAFLQKEGISTKAVSQCPDEICAQSFLLQMPSGEHITTFYPGAMDERYAQPVSDDCFSGSRAGLMTVASLRDNRYFLEGIQKAGIPLFFGMKGDPNAFPKDFLQEVLLSCEGIFMNEAEREQILALFGESSFHFLFDRGKAAFIAVTQGAQGVCLYEKNKREPARYPAVKPQRVQDTTGAGDAFLSGFLYGYLNGKAYSVCAQYGAVLAACVLEETGCCTGLPVKEQFETRVEGSK
uniref:carbohydrate kinase family protein n=1 Tax=Ndongobacter massiliensis TaxID=1871025 RepID=UPI000931C254|nr:carbohydrate kinase family protein [Ndongobacter massiliensis]